MKIYRWLGRGINGEEAVFVYVQRRSLHTLQLRRALPVWQAPKLRHFPSNAYTGNLENMTYFTSTQINQVRNMTTATKNQISLTTNRRTITRLPLLRDLLLGTEILDVTGLTTTPTNTRTLALLLPLEQVSVR